MLEMIGKVRKCMENDAKYLEMMGNDRFCWAELDGFTGESTKNNALLGLLQRHRKIPGTKGQTHGDYDYTALPLERGKQK
ncbi:MAG: hypothetical protein AB3N15_02300 [Paracoccaceae bacterium]